MIIVGLAIIVLSMTACSKERKGDDDLDSPEIGDKEVSNDMEIDETKEDKDLIQKDDMIENTVDIDDKEEVTPAPIVIDEATKEEGLKLLQSTLESIPLKAKEDVVHNFANVSVHDPSVIKVDDTYYIFGSHLAGAKSTDLINWTLIDSGVTKTNKIIPDAMSEMEEAFTWARTNTFWAPDVIQLHDGRFYMYYCNCEGSSPLSALGVAVSDNIEGPYKDLGIILKSGMTDTYSENGDRYNANIHPNAIDPDVFFDKDGRLWMMYGSYSGGIYILELDPDTGFPLESGYGKKLLGKNHLRIEGAFVQYSEETDYYYMFLSFGGLARDGGYNIRVARSKNPDGPYYDSAGQDMIDCQGPSGTFFYDRAAEEYGAKLVGNFNWKAVEGENKSSSPGYISPGHNSTIYDEETGRYYIIFHARFASKGEAHEVRVHQMYLNEDDWFVIAPYRYIGESIGAYSDEDVIGAYKVINHEREIAVKVNSSVNIVLKEDNTVVGDWFGTWRLTGDNYCELVIDGVTYKGVFVQQWDEYGLKNVMTFTLLSEEGKAIWGSGFKALE